MKNCYCLLNHPLTENQIKDLELNFGVGNIIYAGEELKKEWAQISTGKSLDYDLIKKVCLWLESAEENSVLIVQGEFGSTFCIADYALKNKLIPLYAVTKRVEKEQIEGEIVKRQYVFEHCCFRKYEYYSEKCK